MEVQNPRRILAVSLDEAAEHLSKVIKDLTGTLPEPATPQPSDAQGPSDTAVAPAGPSLAGTTHNLPLKTPYYTAQVPVWLDLVSSPSSPEDWASAFLAPEAAEVRAALGGLVVVVHLASAPARSGELLRHAARLVEEGLGGWGWDGVGLAVVVLGGGGQEDEVVLEKWEDLCARGGLEMVRVGGAGDEGARNEFGEKVGIPRVLEALETNDWAAAPSFLGRGDFGEEDDEAGSNFGEFAGSLGEGHDDLEDMDFGIGKDDLAELRKAIWNAEQGESQETKSTGPTAKSTAASQTNDTSMKASSEQKSEETGGTGPDEEDDDGEIGEDDLQKLEGMMRKLQAVRDMSAGLPEDQRRRIAARAVGEVMKDL